MSATCTPPVRLFGWYPPSLPTAEIPTKKPDPNFGAFLISVGVLLDLGIIVQNQLRRNESASPRAFGMFYGMADVTPDLLI